jgi:hypothetical protein
VLTLLGKITIPIFNGNHLSMGLYGPYSIANYVQLPESTFIRHLVVLEFPLEARLERLLFGCTKLLEKMLFWRGVPHEILGIKFHL